MSESRGNRGFIPPKIPAPPASVASPSPSPTATAQLAEVDAAQERRDATIQATSAASPSSAREHASERQAIVAAPWLLLVPAAAAVAYAIDIRDGTYTPLGIGLIVAAIVLTTAGVLAPWPRWRPGMTHVTVALLGLALAVQFWLAASGLPAPNLRPPDRISGQTVDEVVGLAVQWWMDRLLQHAAIVAVAALLAGAVLGAKPFLRALTFPALVAVFVISGVWIVRHTAPNIDVYSFQQASCAALLKGQNPYAMTYADPYHGMAPWYGAGLAHDDRLWFGYPYMPLSLWLTLPGYLIGGDCRYASVAALALAALFIGYSRSSRASFGAAALLLFMSRTTLVVEESWTEPFVVLTLAATLFCAFRLPRAVPWALGLFLASKQYVPLALPLVLLLVDWPVRWRQVWGVLWRAGLVATVVTLPMVLWDVGAFWHSAVVVQMKAPFRREALSLLAWVYALKHGAQPHGQPSAAGPDAPSSLWAFAALLVSMGLALWRCPRNVAGFCGAIALAFLLFFAMNKQAFANYYFFVIGAMCCAVAAAGSRNDEAHPSLGPAVLRS